MDFQTAFITMELGLLASSSMEILVLLKDKIILVKISTSFYKEHLCREPEAKIAPGFWIVGKIENSNWN